MKHSSADSLASKPLSSKTTTMTERQRSRRRFNRRRKKKEPKYPQDLHRDGFRGQEDNSSPETDDYKPQPPRQRRSKYAQ